MTSTEDFCSSVITGEDQTRQDIKDVARYIHSFTELAPSFLGIRGHIHNGKCEYKCSYIIGV